MKQANVLSLTDATPFVTLNVEQFREVVRQEILSAINSTVMSPKRDDYSDKPYLTIAEAAKFTTLAQSTIRLYGRTGKLHIQKVGKRCMLSKVELERLLTA
jgi:hypothetical protein